MCVGLFFNNRRLLLINRRCKPGGDRARSTCKVAFCGSLQLSHISNVGANGYTIAGQTQLTSEGLEITSGYSLNGSDQGGMHISINGKSGISVSGEMNFKNPDTQPALSFYGLLPYDKLLENTIEPLYNGGHDSSQLASGVWFFNLLNSLSSSSTLPK